MIGLHKICTFKMGGGSLAIYKYKAITSEGGSLEGTYNAKNKEEVLLMLRENRYYPVNIKRTDEEKDIRNIMVLGRVKVKDIAIFCRQFYTMQIGRAHV